MHIQPCSNQSWACAVVTDGQTGRRHGERHGGHYDTVYVCVPLWLANGWMVLDPEMLDVQAAADASLSGQGSGPVLTNQSTERELLQELLQDPSPVTVPTKHYVMVRGLGSLHP